MKLTIEIYGIKIQIYTENVWLYKMIKKYYQPFISSAHFDTPDIDIYLERKWYFSRKISSDILLQKYTSVWSSIKINKELWEYVFKDQEISWKLTFTDSTILLKGILKPHPIKHIIHTLLQGPTRIDKFYNRFLIKTCIHDIVFIHLEKKLETCLLHATAVSNGEKTFLFTGLWWSGKSTLASAFAEIQGYTILSDNYAIVSQNKLFPFPEIPRITKWTQKLLWIDLDQKADGTKNYLSNDTTNIENSYTIDGIFICSYGEEFLLQKIDDTQQIFELLYSINNYTKEFPEYLNLSMLSVIWKFNTNLQRIESLKKIVEKNKFFSLQNSVNLKENLKAILDV